MKKGDSDSNKIPSTVEPLKSEALYNRCDPDQFDFETTAELPDLEGIIGQERALEAVRFGIGIRRRGYNMFVLGTPGAGRHTTIRHILEEKAASATTPSDWCYVNNFDRDQEPRYLKLPAGQGAVFRQDITRLVEDLRSAIQAVFESESYGTRKQAVIEELKERHEKAFEELSRQAEERGLTLLQTPAGFAFAPVRQGEVISHDEFKKLTPEEQQQIDKSLDELHEQMHKLMKQAPQWEKESREKIKDLNREITTFAVDHLLDDLRKKYEALPDVTSYLDALQRDVIENVDTILNPSEPSLAAALGLPQQGLSNESMLMRRYQVNLLVDHSSDNGAPVIYEDHPTFQNLVGQIEYMSHLGALVTDYTLIRSGALHRANGGYLVLDAHRVLNQPHAWEGLKRALRSSEIRIESLGQSLGLMSTVSIEPQPIPLDLKVVLIGERMLYYLLCHYDPEFNELFKVAVDFEEDMDRSSESQRLHARMVGMMARQEGLLPFDRGAVARMVEHSSRTAGDTEKLSIHMTSLIDLLRESDYWAAQAGNSVVTAVDVQRAIDAQKRRADRLRDKLLEAMLRGTILIDTDGEKIGQVNGLSVILLDKFAFGHPSRITARVRMGKGEVLDIEREVKMGGPIHSKGVLILSGYLGARYASDHPLSLEASLVFEQSYAGVEGDSASSAELYALLSALSELPVKQSLAVTGSVNQHGEVQAIGGVNEKIEGFFDVCNARGLTGDQGVLIPQANVKHLMLRQDVVDAVSAGKFHIYPVRTIDQGIELMTGLPAGERNAEGRFPLGSLNQRVEARLIELAEKRARFIQSTQQESE
ncbi:MAG: AAA family ATPase [Acidobacteriota bacterium]|nr:MAG: AAA family ATPase [Acidobacteriota bacterium]